MAENTVTVRIEWREVEPDGSVCVICGETIYLKQFQAFGKFGDMPDKEWRMEDCTVCQSCKAQ